VEDTSMVVLLRAEVVTDVYLIVRNQEWSLNDWSEGLSKNILDNQNQICTVSSPLH
jgi:hypothetical protein